MVDRPFMFPEILKLRENYGNTILYSFDDGRHFTYDIACLQQISPVELEKTIRRHPGVLDVAVTGIPDKRGDLPVACVVRRPGHDVHADEIKQLVKDNLADTKQLRGGVIFLDAIPQTASTKIHRRKLKEIAIQMLANES